MKLVKINLYDNERQTVFGIAININNKQIIIYILNKIIILHFLHGLRFKKD